MDIRAMWGLSRLAGVLLLAVLSACRQAPEPREDTVAASAPACIGTDRPDCVVYDSGRVIGDGEIMWDRGLFYQLQGTDMNEGNQSSNCPIGFCAVAILKHVENAEEPVLLAHVVSGDAIWYSPPELIPSPAGPLIVVESNPMGTGHYNDDIVLRLGEGDVLQRLDVQSWKQEARRLVPDANTYHDWRTRYQMLVGETVFRVEGGLPRDGRGSVRVFLVLDGDTLKVGAPPARFPDGVVVK